MLLMSVARSITLRCLALALACSAEVFLQRTERRVQRVDEIQIQDTLIADIEAMMGSEVALAQLSGLQTELRPMFAALPKNEHGNLGHAAVRYALHRYYVQKRGWHVRGIEPRGRAWDASSATSMLEDKVPVYVQEIFETLLGQHGLGLPEVALMVAILDRLVRDESLATLSKAYRALDLPEAAAAEEDVDRVIDLYMVSFVRGSDLSNLTADTIGVELEAVKAAYPSWEDMRMFAQDIKQALLHDELHRRNAFVSASVRVGFDTVARVVERLGNEYGRFHNSACQSMKGTLLELGNWSTGRVPLARFYAHALNEGGTIGQESAEFLRYLGALDESEPNSPRVIVPNYVAGKSNCVAASTFYSVCCPDECEALLGTLERQLQAPEADPATIAALVTELPSQTVEAPRNLSAPLLRRLSEIAAERGTVPLHGRLFSQWMHHAFPRECPYPHLAGTTNPMTADEWMEAGRTAAATADEMRAHVTAGADELAEESWDEPEEEGGDSSSCLPWTPEEELLEKGQPHPKAPARNGLREIARFLVPGAAFAGVICSVARTALRSLRPGHDSQDEFSKHV